MKFASAVSLLIVSMSLAGCSVMPSSTNKPQGSAQNAAGLTNTNAMANSVNDATYTGSGNQGSSGQTGDANNAAGNDASGSTNNAAGNDVSGSTSGTSVSTNGTGPGISAADRVLITAKHVQTKTDDITYAELSGLENLTVQSKLNQILVVTPSNLKLMSATDSYTATFHVLFQAGPLLELEYDSYDFPQGAAHGEPNQQIWLMNLETGTLYTIKDLFQPNSNYLTLLSDYVRQADEGHILDSGFSGVTASDGFVVTRGGVQVFFYPYEWTPFADGFPTFDVSYGQLSSIINTNGSLWKALQRTDTKEDLSVQEKDLAKIVSMGYTPTGNGYTNSAPQFAASPAPHGSVLYAFGATKGQNGPGKVFFFDGSRYLGTDTIADHSATINLRPDGGSSVVATYDYQNGNGSQSSELDMKFLWDGAKLHVTPGFPQNFH